MTVNYTTDSTKTLFVINMAYQSPSLHVQHVHTCELHVYCTLHWAETTVVFLTQSPRPDCKSIIILISLSYLQTHVKKISKLILPCLEAHFGDLIAFQLYGRLQSRVPSR